MSNYLQTDFQAQKKPVTLQFDFEFVQINIAVKNGKSKARDFVQKGLEFYDLFLSTKHLITTFL
jgi:hypothetical protein